jgi:uncharacterized protein (TIGR03435 family)
MRYVKRQLMSPLAVLAIAAGCFTGISQSRAQVPTEKKPLAFEVASVRQSDGKRTGMGLPRPTPGGQGYVVINSDLMVMFMTAYQITDSQVTEAPDWMFLQPRWDVEAKAERRSTPEQLREMFQTLLADRFKLRFHRETKAMFAYILSVEKSGSKLKRSSQLFGDPMQTVSHRGPAGGTRVSMADLCWSLTFPMNAPVVDKTGLDGFYDFRLDPSLPQFQPPESAGPALDGADRNPDIIDALREQLGLKLQYRKTPVEIFVIDHVEKTPTEN